MALSAPKNEYELMRAGMEYKLALQAVRKVIRTSKGSDYEQMEEIRGIVESMETDLRKRRETDEG